MKSEPVGFSPRRECFARNPRHPGATILPTEYQRLNRLKVNASSLRYVFLFKLFTGARGEGWSGAQAGVRQGEVDVFLARRVRLAMFSSLSLQLQAALRRHSWRNAFFRLFSSKANRTF